MANQSKKFESTMEMLGVFSRKGFDIAKEQIVHSSQIVKTKLDITALNREKKRYMIKLAEQVLRAVKNDKIKTNLFNKTIAEIEGLDEKIIAKEEEMKSSNDQDSKERSKPGNSPADDDVTGAESSGKEHRKKAGQEAEE